MICNRTIAATAIAVLLGGCAYPAGSSDYQGYQMRGEQSVRFGVVDTIRPVRINPGNTGLGAASGAALAASPEAR